jgi:prenyltransferase beta subunit
MAEARGSRWRRAAGIALVTACLVPATATAAPPPGAAPPPHEHTVRFLQEKQNADGGFGGVPGAKSDPMISAWAGIALAAAGINPFDQARPGGVDVATYVLRRTRFTTTTDYERAALMAIPAGIPLRDFGGTDLVAGIMRARLPDGSFAHGNATGVPDARGGVNDTAFAIFALRDVPDPSVRDAVRRAAGWLMSVQNPDGGWEYSQDRLGSSADITGAVIQALRAAGHADTRAEHRGLAFLQSMQRDGGGFGYSAEQPEANTASTSWAVQALWSAGIDPASWERGGGDPLDYLRSMQLPSGEILWKTGPRGGTNTLWMTAYAAPAYAGMTWPLPKVPRRTSPAPEKPEAGDGAGNGVMPDGSGDVIAGGGGNGAPLFSRPQPQSRGSTPGGVRQVRPRREGEPAAPEPRRTTAASPPAQEVPTLPRVPSLATGVPRVGGHDQGERSVSRGTGATATSAPASDPSGSGSADEVRGSVIADPRSAGPDGALLPAAPGLRSARRDDGEAVALAIATALAAAALTGLLAEQRRPRLSSPSAPPALGGAR